MTLDMGGTSLRVCKIVLCDEKGKHEMTQHQYRMPDDLKTGNADDLWTYVVDSLKKFLDEHDLNGHENLLGFCFSYPATQERIDHGVLQTWTKGLDIKGVEGEDVAAQLRKAMVARVRLVSRT